MFIIIILSITFTGCSDISTPSSTADDVTEATMSRYDVREIQEYKGIHLDPATGPRDNSIIGIQYVEIEDYSLTITGLVDTPLTFTYDEVLEYPSYERLVTLHCVEGWDATILWEGVKLTDIFDDASVLDTADTVIFKAVDGYTTSMPLAVIKERDMIMAYKANTATIPAAIGYPFIVIAEDKYGYKWTRWVNEIELSDELHYQGYWEKLGYGNNAEVPENEKKDYELE